MKEEQSKKRGWELSGVVGGGLGEGGKFGKKKVALPTLMGLFFSLKIDGVRWTGYPFPN